MILLAPILTGCALGTGEQRITHGLGEHWDATRLSVDEHVCSDSRLVCDRIDPRYFCRCVP
jgi:hypothetical protein